jgi:acetyltransferase-like isoleucine patch superfamily enzyme
MNRIPIFKMVFIGILPSALKVVWYRSIGAKIGRNVKIGLFSIILADEIVIGDGSNIGAFSFIRARKFVTGNRIKIGTMVAIDTGDVKIGHDSVIMEQVVIGGMKTPRSKITIGERVKIFSFSFLNPTEEILIEDEVGVGGANYIFTHGTWPSVIDGYPYSFGKVTIRKGVWLPWRVFIMPGVEIGANTTVGAGAVINKSVPEGSLAVGMPARVISSNGDYIKKLSEEEKIDLMKTIMDEFKQWLEYIGWSIRKEVLPDGGMIFHSSREGEKLRLILLFAADNWQLDKEDILLSWKKVSNKNALKSGSWFDIESRNCYIGTSSLFEEVRNFMSRYGIRFSVFGEKAI